MDHDILVIVKIAERCNLDCTYCYMYSGADQSWRSRPRFLSDEHLDILIARLADHRELFKSASVTLEIHGGEPLLVGKERMRSFLQKFRSAAALEQQYIGLQTNGVLLDNEWLDIFVDSNVQFGISCDGPVKLHDSFRRTHSGLGSGLAVQKAIRMCIERPDVARIFGGVLAVIQPRSDGAEIVQYFHDLGVRELDLLLPDANHAAPPHYLTNYTHSDTIRFYRSAFDRWISIGRPDFMIRIFRTLMLAVFGQKPETDAFGGRLENMAVVESDGSYQFLDVLHICNELDTQTSLHLRHHTLQDFLVRASSAFPPPCAACLQCPAYEGCGGGYLPHRFDGKGYNNPSFYCPVLFDLYHYIHSYVTSVTPTDMWKRRP